MLSKVIQKTEVSGFNKIIRKSFQRNMQSIDTVSAYIHDKLYFRSWEISEYGRKQKFSQTYNAGHPIRNSRSVLDFYA